MTFGTRVARAFGIGLILFAASPYAQNRESELIRTVRELPVRALSPDDDRDTRLERLFAIYARVAVPSIEWRVRDCGDDGSGAATPTCVEGRARTAPDITMTVVVKVAAEAGHPADFSFHELSITQGNTTTTADALRDLQRLAVLATMPFREPLPPNSDGITEIMLERTWCYGICPIDKVELHEDGRAVYAGKQYAPRKGFFSGTLRTQTFNELAQWLMAEGFFDLRGSYGDPNPDTDTRVLRVTRYGREKWVVNHRIRRSLDVLAMERVIGAIAEEIDWQPVQSGIRGVAIRKQPGEAWRPTPASFTVYVPDEEHGFGLETDAEGRFELPLIPGPYRIEATFPTYSPDGTPQSRPSQTLTVTPDAFTEVVYRIDLETGNAEFAVGATGDLRGAGTSNGSQE